LEVNVQIVTDGGMDLTPEQARGLEVSVVPLSFSLDGRTYRSGVEIQSEEFYRLLGSTESFPTTSQPAPGEFAEVYRKLAATDPEILSIHISSGLSGTLASARAGAATVPEARVTFVDSMTLSGAQGWQVEAAARAAKAGWPTVRILALLKRVAEATETVYTLATLKYLIHGGRISHLKGLLASMLDLKPLIGVDPEQGKYVQRGQARTLKAAILKLAEVVKSRYPLGTALRLQVMHGDNAEGASSLHRELDKMFHCHWLPTSSIAPVLGAHTGPGLVGIVFAPQAALADIP
jgi:DegV family protein with EDD domain